MTDNRNVGLFPAERYNARKAAQLSGADYYATRDGQRAVVRSVRGGDVAMTFGPNVTGRHVQHAMEQHPAFGPDVRVHFGGW